MQKNRMRSNTAPATAVFLAFGAFLLTAGLSDTVLPLDLDRNGFFQDIILRFSGGAKLSFSYLAYALIHMAIFGAAVPLYLAKRYALLPFRPVGGLRLLAGTILLAAGLGLGLSAAHAWYDLADPPRLVWILKSAYLGAQMGLAMSIYAFFLIPESLLRLFGEGRGGKTAALAASLLSAGLIHFVEQDWGGNPLPDGLLFALVPFALGAAVGRSVYLTATFCTLTYAAALIPIRHYHLISFRPLHAGFLLMFCIGCMYLSSRSTRKFPPSIRLTDATH